MTKRATFDPRRRDLIRLGLGAGAAAGAIMLGHPARAQAPGDNPMPQELRKALERSPFTPVLGNPDGDITLSEFFDYNCPFCRDMAADIRMLLAEDGGLRLVLREWPIFGEESIAATRVSLAVLKQQDYGEFHAALMGIGGKADEAAALRVARDLGLDTDRLRADMESPEVQEHIGLSGALADHMGLMGTPSFIAGNEMLFGARSKAEMRDLIARGRAALG
ncbi:DsbA family protein [Pontibaca methylaminivorans]|mgnify:CR=1 FL=1|uniref:DsbA family protein n=1 Tax=Pontibaca methylaminivorans TaxID=515897 RepID=UPI002FD8E9F0